MNEEKISKLLKNRQIKMISVGKLQIKSLLNAIKINAEATLSIPLKGNNATIIFRELYESIRQLGDAKWWSLGFEPQTHDVSLEILKDLNIKDKYKLNNLDRFKLIRHDVNYRGFQVSTEQAKELIDFWNSLGKEILRNLGKTFG